MPSTEHTLAALAVVGSIISGAVIYLITIVGSL